MTTDQWIQVGMLAVAAVPLIAFALKRWGYHKLVGVTLNAKLYTADGAFIQAIRIFPSAPPVVTRLAIWSRVHILNRTSAKVIITELNANFGRAEPRPIVTAPVRSVIFRHDSEQPSEIITLPVTIEPGDMWSAWSLLAVELPPKLGRFLYQLYAGEAEKAEGVRLFLNRFDKFQREIENQANKGLQPLIRISELSVNAVDISDPILRVEESVIDTRPRMGRVPAHARGDILPLLLKADEPFPQEQVAKTFVVTAKTAAGRAIRYRFRTARDPFWFFGRKHQNTA